MKQQVFIRPLDRSTALYYYALIFLVMASLGSATIIGQFVVDGFYWLGVVNIVFGLMVPVAGLRASQTTHPIVSKLGVLG